MPPPNLLSLLTWLCGSAGFRTSRCGRQIPQKRQQWWPKALRQFQSLSGGEKQRVMLARALAQQPQLLALDEPTNHLDIAAQLSVLDLLAHLRTTGVTVLAALHDLSLAASYCDHIIVLSHGRVVAAGPTDTVLTEGLIAEVYGVRASILRNPVTGKPLIGFSPA